MLLEVLHRIDPAQCQHVHHAYGTHYGTGPLCLFTARRVC